MSAPQGIELATLAPATLRSPSSAAEQDKLSPFADPSRPASTTGISSVADAELESRGSIASEEIGHRLERLKTHDGEDEAQGLPPVDGGKGAWGFIVASFVLECVPSLCATSSRASASTASSTTIG